MCGTVHDLLLVKVYASYPLAPIYKHLTWALLVVWREGEDRERIERFRMSLLYRGHREGRGRALGTNPTSSF